MGLSTYKQIRFLPCPGTFGNVTLVINRPGNPDLTQAAADTLLLSEGGEYYPFIVDGDFALSKKFTTTRGRRALDDLNVAIRDGLSYTGTVDGSPVSEDFLSSFKTFFDVWFDNSLPYKAFLLYHDNLTGNDEVTHVGWIDTEYAPSSDGYLINPLTDEQIWLGTRTIKMTAFVQAQVQLTWLDVLKNIGSGDCQEGTPYNGFMEAPNVGASLSGQQNTRADLFSSSKGNLMQAVTYKQLDWLVDPCMVKVDAAVWPSNPWTQHVSDIQEIVAFNDGSGYAPGDTGTVNGGSPLAHYVVDTVFSGQVITFHLTDAGAGYSVGTNISTTTLTGTGTGFKVSINKVGTGTLWGPSGLVFISLDTLFSKIATTLGVTAPTVTSALKWWRQLSSGNCFPIDTANPISPGDMYLSLNVLAMSHPYDGSFWSNPAGFPPDTPITDLLSGLCNLLLCDFNIETASDGTQTLVLTPMGETSGTIPPEFQLIGTPQQEEPATGPRSVQTKYRGDNLTIQAPLGVVGDVREVEIPARIHRIGKTSGSDTFPDQECLTWDSAIPTAGQALACFRVSWFDAGNSKTTVMPDPWKGLCYLYWFHSGSSNPGVYPSNWKTFDETTNWTNSFFVVNAVTRAKNPDGTSYTAPADLQAQLSGNDYFNLRDYPAVAFAELTLAKTQMQTLVFQGISDSSGSIQAIKAGLSKTWRFGAIADQNWVGIQIDQLLLLGQTTVRFQQYANTNGFPDLTSLAYGVVGGTGGTSSTTSSSTGNPSGNQDPLFTGYVATNPNTSTRNIIFCTKDIVGLQINANASQTENLFQIYNAAGNLASGINSDGTFFSKIQAGFNFLPFGTSAGNTGEARWYELAANGTNWAGFKAPDSLAANNIYTFPTGYPASSGYVLSSTTAGVLSWVAASSPASPDTSVQFNNGGVFGGDTAFLFDKTTNTVTLGIASSENGYLELCNSGSGFTTKLHAGDNDLSYTFDFPVDVGTAGYVLSTNGGNPIASYWQSVESVLTDAVITDPGFDGRNDIQATGDYNPLRIKENTSGQTTNAFEIRYWDTSTSSFINGFAANFKGKLELGHKAGSLSTEGAHTGELVLYNSGGVSGSKTSIIGGVGGNTWTLQLPNSGGTADYILKTDGTGVTSWVAVSSLVTGLLYWQENFFNSSPNNTVHATQWIPLDSSSDAVISPTSVGAFQLQVADNTTTGGNKRGVNSVDFQMIRSNANQVASGTASMQGGVLNLTSGTYSFTYGNSNENAAGYGYILGARSATAGSFQFAFGEYANAYLYGQVVQSSGRISALGDSQGSNLTWKCRTMDNTIREMFLDADAGSGRAVLPNYTCWSFDIVLSVIRTNGAERDSFRIEGGIYRDANAASTTLISVTVTQHGTTAVVITVTADATNGSLKLQVTGETSKNYNYTAYGKIAEVAGVEV